MLVKLGVDISRLNPEIRRTLKHVEDIWLEEEFAEAVITSTYEGNHSPHSKHYSDDAYDVRLPSSSVSVCNGTCAKLRTKCGEDFDIVLSGNCIHIEYDPN